MLSRRAILSLPAACWLVRYSPLFAASLPDSPTWPGVEWSQTTPGQAGWNPELMSEARRYSASIGTASFMVVQNGVVIDSWGDIDRRLELHSMRKSLLSALIGIAVKEGKITLDATLASLGIDDNPPGLTDAEKQATVRQLLQARSGVYHLALYETEGEKRRRPARGSHAPGTFWYYNNWDFNVLGTIYERATGASIFDSFQQRIATPLGMQDYRPGDGRYIRGADSMHPAYPFRMTARDLARFGLLFLRSGRWRDTPVVPASWVQESTTAWSETYLHSGYGYMWWTGFPDRRVRVMNLSPGGFWADGHNGQYVVVDPANDLVVVHQTAKGKVVERQMGHLMWLVLRAANVANAGDDPMVGAVPPGADMTP
ncbi:serine hydrolase domain-containing protein [Burkholderia paludis]|uniref:serine hydrolase domain-containing protein n=1 Tax=Burkholderia paludis TaxID=1506587 RepID=UPI001F182135|nr:serine hydrolase [Burkholderia paludis]